MMRYFLKQIRFVKWKDIAACLVFVLALPVSWIYKLKRKTLWLVCERSDEARDNGYWFYKYMREQHPEQDCVYAIKKKSNDYHKVAEIPGEIIEFGSFKHWVYYLTATINISSQKEGKPNAAVCHFLEIYGIRKNKRVYLKHGIVKDDLKWHYYKVMKLWLYICAAERERKYVLEKFGYPTDAVTLTGLARYDNLDDTLVDGKTVLIMPTSREWLARPIHEYQKYDDISHFENTEYYRNWKAFLTNSVFQSVIKSKQLHVVFFLHPNMQKYSKHFEGLSANVEVATNSIYDLQTLMKQAICMITDYSSVYFDFAYMRKPLLYYQFDYEKFREGHYQEGYFSYTEDGFGSVCKTPESLSEAFLQIAEHGFVMPEIYLDRVKQFFAFHDCNNCRRIYDAICEKQRNEKR